MRKHTFCQVLFSVTAFLPVFYIGVWRGYCSVVLPRFRAGEIPISMTLDNLSWMVALTDIGGFLSPFPAGYVMDRFGRLTVLRLAFISFLLGSALILVATSPYHICLASLLTGLGNGIAFATPALYVAEIAKPKIRGSLASVHTVMYSVGAAVSMTFGPYISFERLTWATLVCPLVGLLLTFLMVESPYYYLIQNNETSAAGAITQIRNKTKTGEMDVELETIRKKVKESQKDSGRFLELMAQKTNRRAVMIILVIWLVRAAGGYMPITAFAPVTLPADSFWDPKITMMLFAWVNVVTGLLGMSLVDRFNRKTLLNVSLVGLSFLTAVLAVFYYFDRETSIDMLRLTFIPHVCILLFGVFFQLGVCPVATIFHGELLSVGIKGTASAIAVMIQAAATFINSKIYFAVDQSVGVYFMYVVFTSMNLTGVVFTAMYVLETRGRTLAEIQELLNK